ncbi:MAG: FHA domain-containing protein [Oscillospiraceae bacterium]|nr:FHA domain-containing protein [Oscillospiraceae bacterium]
MKKIVALLLCLMLLPAAAALADNSHLGDTTWELMRILNIETQEIYYEDYIDANNMLITFRFENNGEVIITGSSGSLQGTYLLSGDSLEIDLQDDGKIYTDIEETDTGRLVFVFAHVFAEGYVHLFMLTEGTFGGSSPAAPPPDPDPAPAAPDPDPAPATPPPGHVDPTPAAPGSDPPAGAGDVSELEDTTWELYRIDTPSETFGHDDLVRNEYFIEFQFMRNGVVVCRLRNKNERIEERGTYQLTGNELSINIPSLTPIHTVIQDGSFTVRNFNDIGEDYSFRYTSSSSLISGGSGLPRWARDALIGGGIGAAVGIAVWLMKRNKKKSDEATPPGVDGAAPGYYPPPTPMASAPAAYSPGGAQRQLLCTSGPMAGATYPLSGSLRIGRDPARCQIIFSKETAGISSLHCEVQPQPSGALLIDQGSTYGTFLLNGRKLNANESVMLNPGDGFYLAESKNTFKIL